MEKELVSSIVVTLDVANDLKKIAEKHGISPNAIDIAIRSITTQVKVEPDGDFKPLKSSELSNLNDVEYLANPHLEIIQEYDVEFKPQDKKSLNLKMGVGFNPSKTKMIVKVAQGSSVSNLDGLYDKIMAEINKIKLKKNILVGLWDEGQQGGAKELVEIFRKNLTLQEDYRIVAVNIDGFSEPVHDKLINHYELSKIEEDKENNVKVDHFNKGFILGVDSDILLFEYIKPVNGTAGVDCFGHHLEGVEASVENAPAFSPTQNIRVEENEKSIKYYSKTKGFLSFDDGQLDIQDSIDLSKIDIKTTGHIRAGLETGISLNLSETDPMKDAVGIGLEIEVTNLNIKGNVARGTKLSSITLNIDGQTHQDSVINAEQATIKIHKGNLHAIVANIDRLENGYVEADEVIIGEALGGEVRANTIRVSNLKKNARLISNNIIEIDNVTGDDNVLILSPIAREADEAIYLEDKKRFAKIEDQLKYLRSTNNEIIEEHRQEKAHFDDIVNKLKVYKEKGQPYPKLLTVEYKKLKQNLEEYAAKNQGNNDLKDEYKQIKDSIIEKEKNIVNAKVIKDGPWGSYYTKILFKLIKTDDEIEYIPRNSDTEISLTDRNGKYEVDIK